MTNYPGSAISFDYKANFTDTVIAEDVNLAYDEIIAIGSALGTNPATSATWGSGTFATTLIWPTVKARIQNIENGVHTALQNQISNNGGSVITSSGTGVIGLAIAATTDQTVNIFETRTSGGTVTFKVDKDGIPSYNSKVLATLDGTETLSNKTLSSVIINGSLNTITNIAATSVIAEDTTNIKTYVDNKRNVFYATGPTGPTAVNTGDLWVRSDSDVTSFDPTTFISNSSPSVASNLVGYRRITASTSAPTTEGADGDVWLQYIA